jgi:transitional endoplasmic reticulum ATPase
MKDYCFCFPFLSLSLSLFLLQIRASDVLNRWLGGSEATIRSIFARARSAAPCILFFDDLDALASTRDEGQDDDAVVSRILSTFLNEIDGVTRNNNSNDDRASTSEILIISATNRLESIDAALLRPGRLEEHVYLPIPPTPLDCKEIFQIHSRNFPLGPDVDLDLIGTLLHRTGVATGATIEGLCREVCLNVLRQHGDKVKYHDDVIEVTLADFQSVLKDW